MEHLFAVKFAYLIPLLPLCGAILAGLLGARWLKGASHWPIWLGVGASAVISLSLLFGMLSLWPHEAGGEKTPSEQTTSERATAEQVPPAQNDKMLVYDKALPSAKELTHNGDWYTWIQAGNFKATAGFLFDPLSATMLCVVTGIGFFITVFAAGYMKGEEGYFRFFAYLGLFIFAMTILVMGNNFVMLYLGWEGVGLCSYLLVGYYYQRPAAREAAKKAFLVNRIGDFGFGIGIMLIYLCFGTVSYFGNGVGTYTGALEKAFLTYSNVNIPAVPGITPWHASLIPFIPFCLMLGAFGKSAQFPLYVWLPDAMEGPTPVSALIHAATMVTAGIYMIVRCGALFIPNHAAMLTIACVGAFTAFFAATIALRQFDLKKVFAYSTISQLGFMFVGVGVLAPVAGVFHLVTHAFFKALLFLSSGVVMHAMLGHLDMRKMSGLKRVLPKTNILILIGCLSLAGVPFLGSGFFSKDEIVAAAWASSRALGVIMLITALLTAYYTFRLYFRVFQGPELVPTEPAEGHHHADDHSHADQHAHASASAVQSGDTHESGVDTQLAHDAAHHPPAHAHQGGDAHGHHNHEPLLMILPLIVLALGAFFAGYLNFPERPRSLGGFLHESPSLLQSHHLANTRYGADQFAPTGFGAEEFDRAVAKKEHTRHVTMMIISGLISVLGIYVAYLLHLKYRPRGEELPRKYPGASRLLEAKYWVDEIYQAGVVEPLRALGRGFFWVDRLIVDGLVWIIGFVPQLFGFGLKLTTQRGSLQGYAVMMLLGVAAVLLLVFLR